MYVLNMLPINETLETLEDAIDGDNFYQLQLFFKDGDLNSAGFSMLGTDYSLLSNGTWEEDEGESDPLSTIQLSNVLIVPASNTNGVIAGYGISDMYAVPDNLVSSIINAVAVN